MFSYNNVTATVCGNMSSSSVTVCGNVSSSYCTTVCGPVGVNNTSFVNMSPKVSTVQSDASANSVKTVLCMAAVCCSPSGELSSNNVFEGCSYGIVAQELDASSCTGHAEAGNSSDDEVDRIERNSLGDEQVLTTFWEVEEGQHQVNDVQG